MPPIDFMPPEKGPGFFTWRATCPHCGRRAEGRIEKIEPLRIDARCNWCRRPAVDEDMLRIRCEGMMTREIIRDVISTTNAATSALIAALLARLISANVLSRKETLEFLDRVEQIADGYSDENPDVTTRLYSFAQTFREAGAGFRDPDRSTDE